MFQPTAFSRVKRAERILEHHLEGAAQARQFRSRQTGQPLPSSDTVPASGRSKPMIIRASVGLPEPLSPTMPRVSQESSFRPTDLAACRTGTGTNGFLRCSA